MGGVGRGAAGTALAALGAMAWTAGGVSAQPEPVVDPPVHVTADRPELPHSEPFVAVDPRDPERLVAASIVFPDSERARVHAFRSEDGGRRWARVALPEADRLYAVDPWLAFGPGGEVTLSVLADGPGGRRTHLYRSVDGGRSWGPPTPVPLGAGGSQDQGKITADTTRSPYRGRRYLAVQHWGPRTPRGNATDMVSAYRVDGAAPPEAPLHLRPNNLRKSASRPLVASDGTLVQIFSEWRRIQGGPRTNLVWAAVSTDGGRSLGPPSLVLDEGARSWLAPAIAAGGAHPDRIFVASHFQGAEGRVLRVIHSDDLGERWSEPAVVRRVPSERQAFFLRAEADGRGDLAVVWVEHAPGDDRMCHHWYVAVSGDGGERFSDPVPLDGPACHPLPGAPVYRDGAGNLDPVLPRFGRGGDYFGLAGLPSGGFRVMWAATRDGALQLWTTEVRPR